MATAVITISPDAFSAATGQHDSSAQTPVVMDPAASSQYEASSLIIPITSTSSTADTSAVTDNNNHEMFVEIFPEEIATIAVTTLREVLHDENAGSSVWADAAMMYAQHRHAREALVLLEEACERFGATTSSGTDTNNSSSSKPERVRLLASTGLAQLAVASTTAQSSSSNSKRALEEGLQESDKHFTQAGKIDTFFPMTWIGRGMLNLARNKLEQAKFFFQTTLKQCGPVLPALLGMAAVQFNEGDYNSAQRTYAETIRQHPIQSGASTRVGFGLASYRLGQVDRAKAAFARALELNPECVEAMVGAAILDMAGLDESAKDFTIRTERAIKMMSMANLLDHSDAMVQNHLANHYFWKWTPVSGMVQVTKGSTLVKSIQSIPLEVGDPVRIGTKFETMVKEMDVNEVDESGDTVNGDGTTVFRIATPWKGETSSSLQIWKKDYERVFALAKGAYNSTSVQEIQAESLFFLARVYHVREDIENAHKFYDRACKLAPDLTPARFGLAQTLIVKAEYKEATQHLRTLLSKSSSATDALALLGLLEVRSGEDLEEGFGHLRKAIDLDPLNPDLIVLEANALQQYRNNYPKALERYIKAVDLMKRKGETVTYDLYTNMGVLYQETKKFDDALKMYRLALLAVDEGIGRYKTKKEDEGRDHIRHDDNEMFLVFVDSSLRVDEVRGEEQKFLLVSKISADGAIAITTVQTGDVIRIGADFFSAVLSVTLNDEGATTLELAESYDRMDTENAEKSIIYVRRENGLLDLPDATTVAFNIARLHESAGRTLAAIEIHKALVQRNPAYVNSYLRLACIAVDSGSLKECSEWLKIAATSAPANVEVLTLVGNLHLSLCDWKPAQDIFEGLMVNKLASVEAYASLSLGNIYFETLHLSEQRYAKHLQYASDFYKRILSKDLLNAYAANGLGTVLAEKGELFKAKEAFSRVRETSEDTIADAILNLGHIYLALKKHPEALQMYSSYLKRAEDWATPVTSRSRQDDVVDILTYIAFAYYDWAGHTELFNDANAAPADGRYKEAMNNLELALTKYTKKELTLKYNLCMTKLKAANCVLQKLTRNIPRTVEEVEVALNGLEESQKVVQEILSNKEAGNKKITIRTSTLEDFLKLCRANITSAQSHLEDEKKRAAEEEAEREIRRLAAEAALKEEALREAIKKQEQAKAQEGRDRKAAAKMKQVDDLRSTWEREQTAQQAEKERKSKKGDRMEVEHDVELEADTERPKRSHGLFDDSDEEEIDDDSVDDKNKTTTGERPPSQADLFGDSSEDEDERQAAPIANDDHDDNKVNANHRSEEVTQRADEGATMQGLFGDSDDDESDEELVRHDAKRGNDDEDGEATKPQKKRRFLDDEDG